LLQHLCCNCHSAASHQTGYGQQRSMRTALMGNRFGGASFLRD